MDRNFTDILRYKRSREIDFQIFSSYDIAVKFHCCICEIKTSAISSVKYKAHYQVFSNNIMIDFILS